MTKLYPQKTYCQICFLILGSLFIFSNLCSQANAGISDLELTAKVQERYQKMQSLSFSFMQKSGGSLTGRSQTAEGTARFIKSDGTTYMRWDYLSPDRQILTSDGEMLRMYFAQLNQMIITPAATLESDITYSFFTGKQSIEDNFYLAPADSRAEKSIEEDKNSRVIKLIPKKEQSQMQDIHLWISSDALITRIQIQDHFGTITTLSLNDITTDSLEDSLENLEQFHFTPPAGTEIIKQ